LKWADYSLAGPRGAKLAGKGEGVRKSRKLLGLYCSAMNRPTRLGDRGGVKKR